jgi:hypothetical protein
MADPAESENQNLLPVQAYFSVDGTFQTFIGQGQPFYATVNPSQSGLNITNSTINSTTIGAVTPSTGVFTNVATTTGTISTAPTANTDIVNKQYVDAVAQGLNPKQAVKCATTANITLSGLQTIDTYTTLSGDRVLVKNQGTASENGIYVASASGWTRATDMDTWSEVPGAYTVVLYGSANYQTGWVSTSSDTGIINVTAITFVQFSGSATYFAGTGLTLAANTFSITNTGVTAASYGSASKTLTATVNAQGQLTALSASDIAIAGTQITSGLVSPTYGGTGVNNGSNTLTWNASYTLNQSVASGASPTFVGANFSSIPNSALTNSSVTINGTSIALGASATITAANPFALTLGTGLSGTSYDGSSAVTAAIANTGVTAASYTILNATVNAQGQLTAASSASTTGSGNVVLANGPTLSAPLIDNANPYIDFGNGSAVTLAAGRMWYNGSNGSWNLGMGGGNITQQVGEELFRYGKASAAITDSPLQLVYKTGVVGASGVITFAPAVAGITDANNILGCATENIALNGFGRITTYGIIHGITTNGTAYGETWADNDDIYYNPTTGGLTKTLPTAPGLKMLIGTVINAGSGGSGSFIVKLGVATYLSKLSDVQFTSLADTNLLQYDSTAGYWKNVAIGSVSVGTATNLAGGVAGAVPYQSGVGATGFTAAGTTGQVLTSNGTSAPTWTTPTAYATVTDDTTTNATRYPLFAATTAGNLTTEYVSSTKYQFNPSTGVLTATQFSGSGAGLTSIPNSALTNSSITIGSTAISLGATATTIAGLTSVTSTTFVGALSGNASTATTATTATNATNTAITDDTTTNATFYPTFVSNTTGNLPQTVSSTKLKFNPSTGALTVNQLIIAP